MAICKNQFPLPLQHGSTIGIVAPSGRISHRQRFVEGIKILHNMGFQTKFPRELWPGDNYLADTDLKRGEEFNSIWHDSEIDCVMAARGGFGSIRMVDAISTDEIRCTPKLFLGFSDLTLIHSQLNSRAKLVTLHGPVVTSLPLLSKDSLLSLHSLLCSKVEGWEYSGNIEILRGKDTLSGVSTGGNLSTIMSMLGTIYEISWQDKIVFLEDTSEATYRIDRMLTQLHLCGKLQQAAAIILGDFSHGLNLDRTGVMRHHETIWHRVLQLVKSDTPVWADFPFGHGFNNYTIPFGAQLVMDNRKGKIRCG